MAWDVTGFHTGGRQSLTYNIKAGQKRGMGRANVLTNNIVINNYGAMPMRGGIIRDCGYHDPGLSNFEKWTLGIGTGLGVIGTILGALGLGGGGGSVEGAGDSNNKKEVEKEEKPEVKPETKPEPEISVKQQKENEEIAKTKQLAAEFNKVHDEKLGDKADITGTVTVNADGTVSIKDTINTYTYKKENTTIKYNGVDYPVYTLTGAVNNETGNAVQITTQQYILKDGQLVQPNDLDLAGLGIGSEKKETQQPETVNKTPQRAAANNANNANKVNQGTQTVTKQTTKTPAQIEVENWNKQHPEKKVTYNNGKYSTYVSTISTRQGKVGKTITANSFKELQKQVNNYLSSVNNNDSNKYSTGGYSGLGGLMRH